MHQYFKDRYRDQIVTVSVEITAFLYLLSENYFMRDCMTCTYHYHECVPALLCI